MLVVKYENKLPQIVGEVSCVKDFYTRYMKPNRVSNMNDWIEENQRNFELNKFNNDESNYLIITKHSSVTGEALFLIDKI